MLGVYIAAGVSGAHLNPAVTIALAVRRGFPWRKVPVFALAQALDQGTTSSRAIVFDRRGTAVASAQQEFPQIFPSPGHVEHDPEAIWNSQIDTAREALSRAGAVPADLAAIGVTNQRETTVLWERDSGRPIGNAIVWQSRITAPICDRLKAAGHEPLFQAKTGLVVDAYFAGTKIKHILDSTDGLRARAARGEVLFGTIDSFLIWRLTRGARHITDVTNASRTLLFNIHTMAWDDELLKILDVPRAMLPEVRSSSEVYGDTDPAIFGSPVPLPALPAISRRRSSGRRVSNRVRPRTPTAPGVSCCSTRASRRCRHARAC
jgi:glycerol kinase